MVDASGAINPNDGAADFEIVQDSTGFVLKTIDNFFGIYPPPNQIVEINGSFYNTGQESYSYDLQLKATDANGNGNSALSTLFTVLITVQRGDA